MLSSDKEEEECVFFDTRDCLWSEELAAGKEYIGSGELVYETWVAEPLSVKERREKFLHQMGLSELGPKHGVERTTQCSGVESNSRRLYPDEGDEILVSYTRDMECGVSSVIDELEQEQVGISLEGDDTGFPLSTRDSEKREAEGGLKECDVCNVNKQAMSWWRRLSIKKKKGREAKARKSDMDTSKFKRMKVKHNAKRRKELTALYVGQEIQAHKGFIWTMKFSPDGQYLASGGEDGVVRIWRITAADATFRHFSSDDSFCGKVKQIKVDSRRKKATHTSVVLPDKFFQIEEDPLQEFHGHTSDVLDIAWSDSNSLLSSSKDKTVRLWQVGCDQCVNVFYHNDYVTCIQFDPIDENYFISGSIDGKVRIWGLSEKRVVDWADARDVITAICYQPDGKGFIIGSIAGTCRFYDTAGTHIQLDTQIHIQGRKKTYGSKVTGIQFSQDNSQRLMITSEDLKLRIYEKRDIIYKYRGLAKSGSQTSASFTSTGKHIISVGEDSRVYVWNYDGLSISSSKHKKSMRSCEHFFSEGVTRAIPWPGMGTDARSSSLQCSSSQATSRMRDSERFSLGNWFSIDGPCRGSATWPEEKLPNGELEEEHYISFQDLQQRQQQQKAGKDNYTAAPLETWGLVIVTAGWDGTIRTFHNYGLPVRLC